MPDKKLIVVLVHGWSVYNTNTYGKLAARLKSEAKSKNIPKVDVVNIWLSKYISFKDEVKVADLAAGLENAVQKQLGRKIANKQKCVFITHSTGGPVVREWWNQFYLQEGIPCPMSHLIMLAPANFGSSLAQLGKSRLTRVKSWFEKVEPGQGVLDWLELGSARAWELNKQWITRSKNTAENGVFVFSLTGQTIDRKLYDHVNPYTGELGSDGVVRVPAANMNAGYIKLIQSPTDTVSIQDPSSNKKEKEVFGVFEMGSNPRRSKNTAFTLIEGRSHSGEDIGILRSIKNNTRPHPTIDAIAKAIKVKTFANYKKVIDDFNQQTEDVHKKERLEIEDNLLIDREFFHDQTSMIIFRITDDQGYPVHDYDVILTGPKNNPNSLPSGFLIDKQRNKLHPEIITFFINYDLMNGADPVPGKNGEEKRPALTGLKELGMMIRARPDEGFVHYKPGILKADLKNVKGFLKPNETIMVDIVLNRVVHEGVFEITKEDKPKDFRDQKPGKAIKG